MSLFRRKTKIRVIQREHSRIDLSTWREQPDLVKRAYNVLNNPDFRMMLDVLDNAHPAHVVLADNAPIETRALWQARCEGYTLFSKLLESMGEMEKPQHTIEATFEPPEQEGNFEP